MVPNAVSQIGSVRSVAPAIPAVRQSVQLSPDNRPSKKRAITYQRGAPNAPPSAVKHHREEEEEVCNDRLDPSEIPKRNFDVLLDDVFSEARNYAAHLSEKPGKSLELLTKSQVTVANL